MDNIPLGTRVTDAVTGFHGTATAKIQFLGDDIPVYRVEPQHDPAHSGDPERWIPQNRLQLAPDCGLEAIAAEEPREAFHDGPLSTSEVPPPPTVTVIYNGPVEIKRP